jgi:hypothetical protein
MRFATLEPERMSPAQKRVYDAIVSGPRGGARGPFGVLLRSPELADRVQKVGKYLRFSSSLPARLNEFCDPHQRAPLGIEVRVVRPPAARREGRPGRVDRRRAGPQPSTRRDEAG